MATDCSLVRCISHSISLRPTTDRISRAHNYPSIFILCSARGPRMQLPVITEYEAALPVGAWPNWVVGNHDQPRIATRIGSAKSRIAAMLLLTLRGTPTMYYGDEIGMTDVVIPAAEVQDPAEKNEPGKGQGRDPERTPMQWDSSRFAGFTEGTPWLRLGADHATVNVATLSGQSDSVLSLYRTLIGLRNANAALNTGRVEDVASNGKILRYERVDGRAAVCDPAQFERGPGRGCRSPRATSLFRPTWIAPARRSRRVSRFAPLKGSSWSSGEKFKPATRTGRMVTHQRCNVEITQAVPGQWLSWCFGNGCQFMQGGAEGRSSSRCDESSSRA